MEQISKYISNKTLSEQMGIHYKTRVSGKMDDIFSYRQRDIENLEPDYEYPCSMEIYEKIGPSFYDNDKSMFEALYSDISNSAYRYNEAGLIAAKAYCLYHHMKYLKSLIFSLEKKLYREKKGVPLSFIFGDRKKTCLNIINKISNIESMVADKELPIEELVEKYGHIVKVNKLNMEQKRYASKTLPEDHYFYYVDTKRQKVFPVKAILDNCNDYDFDKINGEEIVLSYVLRTDDNIDKHYLDMRSKDNVFDYEIPCNLAGVKIFCDKKDAFDYVEKKMKETTNNFQEMINILSS